MSMYVYVYVYAYVCMCMCMCHRRTIIIIIIITIIITHHSVAVFTQLEPCALPRSVCAVLERCELLSSLFAPRLSGAICFCLWAKASLVLAPLLSGASCSCLRASIAFGSHSGREPAAAMEPAARNPRASEAPVSARADEPAADGWVHFESDLKPYQCKMLQLTMSNLLDLLPGFEGASLHVDKLRRLGETAHRMVKSLRAKFRGDLD